MVQAIGIWLAALFYVPYIFLAVYLTINVFCSLIIESFTETLELVPLPTREPSQADP